MRLKFVDSGSDTCYLAEKTSPFGTFKNVPVTAPPGTQFDYGKYEEMVGECLAYQSAAGTEIYAAVNARTGEKVQLTCDGVRHMMIRADGNNTHDVLDPHFLTCLDKVVSYGFKREARNESGNMNFIAQWNGTANQAVVAYNPLTGDIVSVHTNSGSKPDDFAGCAAFVS